jgi:hypothetical protein
MNRREELRQTEIEKYVAEHGQDREELEQLTYNEIDQLGAIDFNWCDDWKSCGFDSEEEAQNMAVSGMVQQILEEQDRKRG